MIKSLLLLLLLLPLGANYSYSQESCPKFTPEQEGLIFAAYYKGLPEDLGYTLASITWQEAFVGKWVVKVNNRYDVKRDKHYESYGVTHIELSTAMYLLKIKNSWQARAEIVPRLINDNNFAWELALMKLRTLKRYSWAKKVEKYNGISEKYRKAVIYKVKILKSCYKFERVREYNFYQTEVASMGNFQWQEDEK